MGIPPHQFEAVFQSVLVAPSQMPVVQEPDEMVTLPFVEALKYVVLIFVAPDPVPPQVPEFCSYPPRLRVEAVLLVLLAHVNAAVPAIDKLPFIVSAALKVFVPLLLKARLLYVRLCTVWFPEPL